MRIIHADQVSSITIAQNLSLLQQCKLMPVYPKARRTRRGKCLAKWHECHFAQQHSRRVRMMFAEEILICAAEENIYHV